MTASTRRRRFAEVPGWRRRSSSRARSCPRRHWPTTTCSLPSRSRKLARSVGKGDYAAACPKLEASQKLEPAVGTQFNLADCFEHVGRTASAYALFSQVVCIAHSAGKFEREKSAKERAAALEPKLARVRLEVTAPAPGLEVRIDDVLVEKTAWSEAFPIDPGEHRGVSASAPSHRAWEGTLSGQASQLVVVKVPELVDTTVRVAPAPVSSVAIAVVAADVRNCRRGNRRCLVVRSSAPSRASWRSRIARRVSASARRISTRSAAPPRRGRPRGTPRRPPVTCRPCRSSPVASSSRAQRCSGSRRLPRARARHVSPGASSKAASDDAPPRSNPPPARVDIGVRMARVQRAPRHRVRGLRARWRRHRSRDRYERRGRYAGDASNASRADATGCGTMIIVSCTNTFTDTFNCGACGHDCLGG